MIFLYNIFLRIYYLSVFVSGCFNHKANLWLKGRKSLFKQLETAIKHDRPIVWVHCASLGEFEQGRPVIEEMLRRFQDKRILITFFSPSGFEVRKDFPGADYIFYLPLDTARNAKRFISVVKPELAVFVKYEYWFNYINILKSNGIPLIYISAIFRPGQRFFRWYGRWQLSMLKKVDHFFVQNETSATLLNNAGIDRVTVSGDTRFDRVARVTVERTDMPLLKQFVGNNRLFIAGSTWPVDEKIIIGLIKMNIPNLKFLIAPHEVDNDRINGLIKALPQKSLRFSECTGENILDARIVVLDSIGLLSHLYYYGTIAYIGGGFGVGIHNILEAAAFGKPVLFGPNYHRFTEAVELRGDGGAISVDSAEKFLKISAQLLEDKTMLSKMSKASGDYVAKKLGATKIIMDYIPTILAK
jgi:3-deoxy-D-manno-octulosonic-acid transferase